MKRTFKRWLSLALACVMALSLLPVTALAAGESRGNSATIEIGEQMDLSGSSYTYNNWISSDSTVVEVQGNGRSATVTGVSDGTATITHSGYSGYYYQSEQWTVTVKKASVYVYVQFVDETGAPLDAADAAQAGITGLVLNNSGWFTYGKIENATGENPDGGHPDTALTESLALARSEKLSRFQDGNNIVNESITIGWYGNDEKYEMSPVSTGADNYVPNGWTWHLNVKISIATVSNYTVKYYNVNTLEPVKESITKTATIGETVTASPVEVPGYTFTSSSPDPATITIKQKEDLNVITFYYTPNTYTITYELDGGANAADNPGTYTYGKGVDKFEDATKTGYTFEGWYSDKDFTQRVTKIGNTETENKILYAKWESAPATYTITYDPGDAGNSASSMPDKEQNVPTDKHTVSSTTPVWTGHTFTGWTTDDVDGQTKIYRAGEEFVMPATDVTFTANWKLSQFNYTVEYYYDNVKGDAPADADSGGTADFDKTITISPATSLDIDENHYILTSRDHSVTITDNASANVIKVHYEKDNWSDKDDAATGGDGIPDKYQMAVTFGVTGGYWNDTTDNSDKVIYVTLTDEDGNYSASGSYTLTEEDVPSAGSSPAENYVSYGWWHSRNGSSTELTNGPVGIVVKKYSNTTIQYHYLPPITLTVTVDNKAEGYDGFTKFGYDGDITATVTTGLSYSSITYGNGTDPEHVKVSNWSTDSGSANRYHNDGDVITVNYTPANGTNAGTYSNASATYTVMRGDTNVTNLYNITVVAGNLTISPSNENKVTSTNYSDVYDGAPHSISAEAAREGSELLYSTDESNEKTWSSENPTFTDAGTYTVYVKAINSNYEDTDVVSATVTITQRPITVTADSASKVYDGTPLTKDSWTITNGNLVNGHDLSATVTGNQTNIGSSENKASKAKITDINGKDVTANYKISYEAGILEVKGTENITVTKTPKQTNVTVGNTATWTVTVTNNGLTDVKGLTLVDTLAGAVVTAPQNVNPKDFALKAKESVSFTVTYQTTSIGSLVNHVDVSQPKDGPDGTSTTETVAKDDSDPINVIRRHSSSGQPSTPVLNTEDHYAYIIGYEDNTVRPGSNITRAEVATIFFRLLTDESRTAYWSTTNSYTDVAGDAWYNNAISTLSKAGIINGYADGSFRPNATITRAEFATIAARFSDVVYNGSNQFTDVPDSHWAARYIALAEHLGWINGYEDHTFKPEQPITRAESMTLINRVLERAVEKDHMLSDMVTWTDNQPSAWYYEAVQEATNSHEYVRTKDKVPNLNFNYENWQKLLPVRDWSAFEKAWADANSSSQP